MSGCAKRRIIKKEESGDGQPRKSLRPNKGKRKLGGGDDSDDSADFVPTHRTKKNGKKKAHNSASAKRRRVRYGWACTMCKVKHRSCDGQRPCNRCRNEGFADSCHDSPTCVADDVYNGKEPNRQFSCRNEEPITFLAGAEVKGRHTCRLLEHEQEIFAKVAQTVAMATVSKLEPNSSNETSPTSSPMLKHEPFLFQFLEPPSWHITSRVTPGWALSLPGPGSYLPSNFVFDAPFSSFPADEEEEEDQVMWIPPNIFSTSSCTSVHQHTSFMPTEGASSPVEVMDTQLFLTSDDIVYSSVMTMDPPVDMGDF